MNFPAYLLDSTFVIDYLHGEEYTYTFLETYLKEQKEADRQGEYYPSLSISIITYGEVYQGIFYGKERDKIETAFLDFIQYMQIHEIDQRIAKRFAFIRGKIMQNKQTKHLAHPKNNYDLYIAATALEFDMMLVTNNIKDYKDIPQLKLY